MSILPSETVAGAVVAHFGLTLGKVLPFARGYAAALGIAPEHLTVANFFRYVRREGFEMVDALVAFLDGHDAGGTSRFTADTRRVYRQLLKHFACWSSRPGGTSSAAARRPGPSSVAASPRRARARTRSTAGPGPCGRRAAGNAGSTRSPRPTP